MAGFFAVLHPFPGSGRFILRVKEAHSLPAEVSLPQPDGNNCHPQRSITRYLVCTCGQCTQGGMGGYLPGVYREAYNRVYIPGYTGRHIQGCTTGCMYHRGVPQGVPQRVYQQGVPQRVYLPGCTYQVYLTGTLGEEKPLRREASWP